MENVDAVIDGAKISALKGEDLPIVYIHGSGCDASIWMNQLEELGGYAVDLPNHGKSCFAEIRSVDDYAYFVAKFVKKILGKAIIIGHSLGGAIVQKICIEYGDIVKAVGLISTGARLRVLPEILQGLEKNPDETSKIISEFSFLDSTLKKKYSKIFAERNKILLKDLMLCDKFDLLDKYRNNEIKILCPTVIVVGRYDKLTPPKYSQFLNERIKSSEIYIVDNAGHMVMLEKPVEFNRILKNFIERLV
ncbi:MAG: alpha/beta hydrolase [Archaeoglobaceae archaeon]